MVVGTMARSFPGAAVALAALALAAGCDGGGGGADAGSDLAIVITPDAGKPDPGTADPGRDTAPADPGGDAGDPGKPPDPGIRDPGPEDPGEDPGFDPGGWDPGGWDPGSPDPGCQPDCAGKECGGNGCGGTCGSCTAPKQCLGGTCQCVPSCSNKACGDDGCGGSCGDCGGVPCVQDAGGATHCATTGPCKQTTDIECADLSSSAYNGAPSSNGDKLDLYPAACGSALAHGPEKAFRFVPDQTGYVTFTLSGHQDYLNLYALTGGACQASSCTQWNHDTLTLSVTAGVPVYVVVDAVENNAHQGPSLAIDCDWYVPPVDD